MGLPLQVRREIFTGVGQNSETFSKTNSTSDVAQNTPSEGSPKSRILNLAAVISGLKASSKSLPRFAMHAVVVLGVVLSVGVGRVSSQASLSTNLSDQSQTSMIATAATLSEGSQNLLAADINQKAKDLNAQTELASSSDEFLAKRQPVMTAGSVSREISTYTVKDGDTLSSLSQKFNITTDTIKWANNIADENSIKPGTRLAILPVSGILYTAEGNDDLSAVAAHYSANPALIDSFNNLEGKPPTAGQKLVIPDGVKMAPVVTAQVATTRSATVTAATMPTFRGGSSANSYSYGYCTWYVASRRYVPGMLGNANQWPYNAARGGMNVSNTPVAGAAGVVKWGNHVVYIERVEGATVYYTEMNGPAGWGRVNSGSAPASNFRYVY